MGPIMPWATFCAIETELVELVSINTVPANDDEYGQLSAGELVLNAKLSPIADLSALARMQRIYTYCFAMDEPDQDYSGTAGAFLPLVEAPTFTFLGSKPTICGLVLRAADNQPGAFQRVGFAAVSNADGSVGGHAQCHIEQWKSPPWPREELERVVLV